MVESNRPDSSKDSASKDAIAERRRTAVLAGYNADPATATALLHDKSADVRIAALGAVVRLGAGPDHAVSTALTDPDATVRRRAAELAAALPDVDLDDALVDDDTRVVEMAAWASGERADAGPIPLLITIVEHHADALCREAAVAALGALGDESGLPAILAACTDKATVRRRAVLALAPFEGSAVDEALETAAKDRDWQVRQAAEDMLGIGGSADDDRDDSSDDGSDAEGDPTSA